MKTILNKNFLIFSDFFKKQITNNDLVLVDAGGRGGAQMPWNEIDRSILTVIGFEPDKKECEKLNKEKSIKQTYIPAILWSEKKEMDIYITKDPSCSSVFEPNIELINKYEERNWKSKIIDKKIRFPTTTIDFESTRHRFKTDFLKIDTHGAEHNILKGSTQALKNDIIGVLVETWTVEVYKGQPTSDTIIGFMKENGFDLFDLGIAAAWKRSVFGKLISKKQIIGLDLLFLRASNNKDAFYSNLNKALKAASIAELYGYSDYALEIIEEGITRFPNNKYSLETAKQIIISNASHKESYIVRSFNRIRPKLFGIKFLKYPKLHP